MPRTYATQWILLSILVVGGYAYERPSYILPCQRSDPELNDCIKNSFNHLKPLLADGLVELGVPSIDPLIIDEMAMENDAGAVRIKALFTDIVVNGSSNFTVNDVKSDLSKLRIDLELGIPRLELRGKYEVIGNVLLLPVRSSGDFWAKFRNISAVAKLYGKEVIRDNEKYMNIDKLAIDFTMKNARFKVKDDLSDRNVLGEAINHFLNTNAQVIVHEMRPAASQSIAKLFLTILNNAFNRMPINSWLLEDNAA